MHTQAAIAATVGSVTIPWMTRSRLRPAEAATLVAGNAGMGITFPFSASMFVLVGSAAAGKLVTTQQLILPLAVGGLWAVLHRLIVTGWVVRRSAMTSMPVSYTHLDVYKRQLDPTERASLSSCASKFHCMTKEFTVTEPRVMDQVSPYLERLRLLPAANVGDAQERVGVLDGQIRALWKGARAVSYTHLDVYKRQGG